MRLLLICVLIAVAVFLVSGGHVLFLPLVVLPLGLVGLGRRGRRQRLGGGWRSGRFLR